MNVARTACHTTAALCLLCSPVTAMSRQQSLPYPDSRREARIDHYHGVEIVDEYGWLEELEAAGTSVWIDAQEALYEAFLDRVPGRDALRRSVAELRVLTPRGRPVRAGPRTFYIATDPHEWRPVLHVTDRAGDRVLHDPRAAGGGPARLFGGFEPSRTGAFVAYWSGPDPSPWHRVRVLDVDGGRHVGEETGGFHAGRSTLAWLGDDGFFYTRYDEPPAEQRITAGVGRPRIAYHRVGGGTGGYDVALGSTPAADATLTPAVTPGGRRLVVTERTGAASRVWSAELGGARQLVLHPLVEGARSDLDFVGGDGDVLRFRTDAGAPNGRLIALDVHRPAPPLWAELVAERADRLVEVTEIGGRLVLRYESYPAPRIRIHDMDGTFLREAQLPTVGAIGPVQGDRERPDAYYGLGSIAEPGTIYRLDVETGRSEVAHRAELPYEAGDYVVEHHEYRAPDGTHVPMFLARHRAVTPGPSAPAILYGYGSFGFVSRPLNLPHIVAWLEMGGLYAVAGIRGGGERGEAWHAAGRGLHKQTSIDDFIAGAEYLAAEGLADPRRIVANGGSAGAIVAAAAVVQRPGLFGAALIDFPVLDLLRYHRFGSVGSLRVELGTSDDAEAFQALRGYSPYHGVRPGACYPPTLVQVGEHDPAATPSHGYKFVAALQAAQACPNPVVLRVARGAGHGHGATNAQRDATTGDQLAFLVHVLGLEASSR